MRRVVVVGGGRMGSTHIQAARHIGLPPAAITVVEPNPSTRLRHKAAGLQAVGSMGEVKLNDAALWVIATPTVTHASVFQQVRNMHPFAVLLEKPCALTDKDLIDLKRSAQHLEAPLAVGLWRRRSSPFLWAKDLLTDGRIGTPRAFVAQQWDAEIPDLATQSPAVTGGLGLDCGVHETDTAHWLGLGLIEHLEFVKPSTGNPQIASGDSDQLMAITRTDRGIIGSIALSRTAGGVDRILWKVIGTAGSIEVELDTQSVVRVLTPGKESEHRWTEEPIQSALVAQMIGLLNGDPISANLMDIHAAAMPWYPTT